MICKRVPQLEVIDSKVVSASIRKLADELE